MPEPPEPPANPGTPDVAVTGSLAVADHQASYARTVEAPQLRIEKTVINASNGNPAYTAEPGETLGYTVTISNIGPLAANNFSFADVIDRLNMAPGLFVQGSLSNVSVTEPDGVNVVTVAPPAGVNNTDFITVTDLDLTAAGGGGDSLAIYFDATLKTTKQEETIMSRFFKAAGKRSVLY